MQGVDLDLLHSVILAQFPELVGLPCRALTDSWDCVALDVGDQVIFKCPRNEEAAKALEREARTLAALRGRVAMQIPDMTLHTGPPLFSSHPKIPGQHLLAREYELLPEAAKARLGRDLGRFYAELHQVDVRQMTAAGSAPLPSWGPAEQIWDRAWPLLPEALRPEAEAILDAFAALPADPHGTIFGFFDGHGWNMAFDHQAQHLNGIYDFADSGLGPLHQEFIYSSMISAHLTTRVIAAYEVESGRSIDRHRVDILTGAHRLWELAEEAHDPVHARTMLQGVIHWQAHRAEVP